MTSNGVHIEIDEHRTKLCILKLLIKQLHIKQGIYPNDVLIGRVQGWESVCWRVLWIPLLENKKLLVDICLFLCIVMFVF